MKSATGRAPRHPRGPGRSTGTFPAALALVLTAVLTAGCGFKQLSGPDLGEIYDRAAQYHRTERNPVIVIPGVMGSELVDGSTDTIVWGAFSGNFARPNNPEGARLGALPMREGTPLAELTDDVRPDGVLDSVRVRFAGIPLTIRAYFYILGALGAGGYRDQELGFAGAID